jgi:hypothetical protein
MKGSASTNRMEKRELDPDNDELSFGLEDDELSFELEGDELSFGLEDEDSKEVDRA